jgi:hypothetical protein
MTETGMKIKVSSILVLSLIFLSWTNWFAPTAGFLRFNTLWLVLAILAYRIILFGKDRCFSFSIQKHTELERFCLNGFIVIVALSALYNISFHPTNLAQMSSDIRSDIGSIFICFYLYSEIIERCVPLDLCVKGLAYGGIVVLFIITLDSILVNFFDIRLNDTFRSISPLNSTAYYHRAGIWISPPTSTHEPGRTAQLLNIIFPFVLLHFHSKKMKIFFSSWFLFCLFSTFSSTGLAICLAGVLVTIVCMGKLKIKLYAISMISLCVLFLATVGRESFLEVMEAWEFIDKITFSGETGSDSERSSAYQAAVSAAFSHPWSPWIGNGPGYAKTHGIAGYLSTFFDYLGNYGLIAFTLFLCFWILSGYKCWRLPNTVRPYLLYSFLACFMANMVERTSSFDMWILFPIIIKFFNETRHQFSSSELLSQRNIYAT